MDIAILREFMNEDEKEKLSETIMQTPDSEAAVKFWKNSSIRLLQTNLFEEGEWKITDPETLFYLGYELGDITAKRGMIIDNNLDKNTIIQKFKKSVPASLVHVVKQYMENRKSKADDEYHEMTSEMEKI